MDSGLAISMLGGFDIFDDREGRQTPIFNPREFEPSRFGWHLHFILGRLATTSIAIPQL